MVNDNSPWWDDEQDASADIPTVDVETLPVAQSLVSGGRGAASYRYNYFDGEKFAGGFGTTSIFVTDYWTLRRRSAQLFRDNLYARGLIRRLITNELNTGLTLDSNPEFELIPGMTEDDAIAWSEDVERRWRMFSKDPRLCDYREELTEGELQKTIRRESLVDGDILAVQRFDRSIGMSRTQLIRGEFVRSPTGRDRTRDGVRIEHGVELDSRNRHVAYWVIQEGSDKFERMPAVVAGRRVARLIYGTDRRYGEVRGEPLLSLILQSLKEVDRYRDATQRAAVINSLLAMYIQKDTPTLGSRPLTGGAIRHDQITVTNDDGSDSPRTLNFDSHLPGIILDELQPGEKPVAFKPDGAQLDFPVFESAVIEAIAWANEIPGEIVKLAFGQSYSASQAAVSEFKMYIRKTQVEFADQYCTPRYHEWLYNELLTGRVVAPGLLDAWDDPREYTTVNAWREADWAGTVKPMTDPVKQANAQKIMIEAGLTTRARAAKELNGSNALVNMRTLKRENQLLSEATGMMVPATPDASATPTNNVDDGEQ